MNKAVILLSGGLDSFVALDIAVKNYDVVLALTFDYGQKAFLEEEKAAIEISNKYNIEQKTIQLPFLGEITNNALTDEDNKNLNELTSVWIPNRNGLFLNIASAKKIIPIKNVIGVKYIFIDIIPKTPNKLRTRGIILPRTINIACLEKNPEFLILYLTKLNIDKTYKT